MGKQTSLPQKDRELLFERTGGVCEWCGRGMRYEDMADHHRKLRGQGGGWELSNQMGTHHACHNVQPGSIHQEPELAKARGAIVSSWQNPAEVEVLLAVGYTWALYRLDDAGGKELVDLPF